MKIEKSKALGVIKYSGIFLLLFMAVLLVLSSSLYYFHISLTKLHFIVSFLFSIVFLCIIRKKLSLDQGVLWKVVLLGSLVLLVSMVTMSFIYDRSSDGNTYHKDAIGNLYLGWNPVYESSSDFVLEKNDIENYNMHSYDIWKDHYAKANWILEASIYKLTDNIESGKAINLVFMYILFVLSFSYFYQKLGKKSLLLSLAFVFNPICCNQLFTFYNDQLGVSLFFTLLVILIQIVDKKDENAKLEKFANLFFVFIIITNIKFNIMGYAMIFTFVFMVYLLIISYKDHKFLFTLKRLVPYFILLFFLSFGVIGYSTYIKNFMDHGNFFYPIYGEKKEDIITAQQPADFLEKNTIEKFFIGTFAETNNLQMKKKYTLKIPFTVSKDEIKETMSIDTRLGGYGIIFSGLFCISLFVLSIYLKKAKKQQEKTILLCLCFSTIFIILIISESWWARYNPTTYVFLLSSLYLVLKYSRFSLLNKLFIILIGINAGLILLGNTCYSVMKSIEINHDLKALEKKHIRISFHDLGMTGILYNLKDRNITYTFEKVEKPKMTYYKYLYYEVKDGKNKS